MNPFSNVVVLGNIVDETKAHIPGPSTDPANNPLCHHNITATHPTCGG